jgi:hypothetical protein
MAKYKTEKTTSPKKNKFELVLFIFILTLAFFYFFKNNRQPSSFLATPNRTLTRTPTSIPTLTPTLTPTPTPTPTPKPIPHGKIEFTTSLNNIYAPKASKGYIDPYDPKEGSIQRVGIILKDEQVKSVKAILQTDHKKNIYEMKLIQGDPSNGLWEGQWKITDTYDYIYLLTIEAQGAKAKGSTTITLR